jgi:hypothetical protein
MRGPIIKGPLFGKEEPESEKLQVSLSLKSGCGIQIRQSFINLGTTKACGPLVGRNFVSMTSGPCRCPDKLQVQWRRGFRRECQQATASCQNVDSLNATSSVVKSGLKGKSCQVPI